MIKIKDFNFLEGLRPKKMFEELSKTVIDQEAAINKLSVSIYNHYNRLLIRENENINLNKNNIFMIGETGSGKTLIIKTLRDIYNIPIFITSATEYTAEGYVGKSVTEIIVDLYNQVGSKGLTENSIVFIDEIDKIASKKTSSGIDVNGEEVQNSLLKIIEGTDVILKIKDKDVIIDTSNILFICAGAFSGIDKIIKDRTKVKNNIGFIQENQNKDCDKSMKIDDIAKYGFKREFIGRFNTVIELNKLNEKSLIDILKKSKESILRDFEIRFKYENCDFKVSHYALVKISEIAIENKTGARGLNKVFYDLFSDVLTECINDKDSIKNIYVSKEDIINNKVRIEYENI